LRTLLRERLRGQYRKIAEHPRSNDLPLPQALIAAPEATSVDTIGAYMTYSTIGDENGVDVRAVVHVTALTDRWPFFDAG